MYHSVHFDLSDGSKRYDTYTSFHLIPDGRPDVASPGVKTNYVDIPGTNGSLDYTEALNGLTYQNRTGSWEFYVLNDYGKSDQAWAVRWKDLMKKLHGQYFDRIWLEDEGVKKSDGTFTRSWYYQGRISVNEWKSDPQFSKVVLDYTLEPYKRREAGSSTEWLWNDLFASGTVDPFIKYGTFTVSKSKVRIVVNGDLDDNSQVPVTTYCSTPMTLERMGKPTITLPAGETENAFVLGPGPNYMVFKGNGTVTLSYDGSMMSL